MDTPGEKKAIEESFVANFLDAPIDTTLQTLAALRDAGYFDLTVLYRQFYDPSAALLQPITVLYYFLFGALIFFAKRATWPSHPTLLEYVFPKRTLQRKSFVLDIQWFVLTLLRVMSSVTALLSLIVLLRFLSNYLSGLDYASWFILNKVRAYLSALPLGVRNTLLFLTVIVITDLLQYWYHRMLHGVPFFWHFHKIHHYPRQITLLANWRGHPVEQVAGEFVNTIALTFSVALWAPLYSPQSIRGEDHFFQTELPVFWAVIAVQQFFHAFNHSTIYIRFGGWLDKVFYSPALHMVHHARDYPNKNFANVLSLWDVLFGTIYMPQDIADHYRISQRLGVSDMKDDHYKTVVHAIIGPFIDCVSRKRPVDETSAT
jgi:sterol desaturase/sphingolipid hydroxylase (fatty acid hydroxylase superfamily)